MSASHLAALGQQILRAIEGDQLKTTIALMSLEDLHRLLVIEPATRPRPRDSNPWQNPAFDAVSAQRGRGDQLPPFWDESYPAVVIGPHSNPEMMKQASTIPFLYHRQQ